MKLLKSTKKNCHKCPFGQKGLGVKSLFGQCPLDSGFVQYRIKKSYWNFVIIPLSTIQLLRTVNKVYVPVYLWPLLAVWSWYCIQDYWQCRRFIPGLLFQIFTQPNTHSRTTEEQRNHKTEEYWLDNLTTSSPHCTMIPYIAQKRWKLQHTF